MINVFISGHIGRDAEHKEINGKMYNVFSVASTRGEVTTWIDCVKADAEGKLTKYIRKGGAIAVSGTISVSAYTNKDGGASYKITCWCNDLQLLGKTPTADNTATSLPNTAAPTATQPRPVPPPKFPTNTEQMNALRQTRQVEQKSFDDLPF